MKKKNEQLEILKKIISEAIQEAFNPRNAMIIPPEEVKQILKKAGVPSVIPTEEPRAELPSKPRNEPKEEPKDKPAAKPANKPNELNKVRFFAPGELERILAGEKDKK